MDADGMEICRLCFCTQIPQINIFHNVDSHINIAEVISEHIGEVNDCDALPKTVCIDCWNTTKTFHKFHQCVKSAQTDYLNGLVKHELTSDLDVSEPFGDESDIKPPNFVEVVPCNIAFDDINEAAILTKMKRDVFDDLPTNSNSENLLRNVTNESSALNTVENRLETKNYDFAKDSDDETESLISVMRDTFNGITVSNESNEIIAENFDFSCDVCQMDLKSLKRAIIHYKNEHDIVDGYVKCCGLKLRQQELIDEHIEWHINPDTLKCPHCNKIMKTKCALSRHMYRNHNKQKFTCDKCGKMYSEKNKIETHWLKHVNWFDCKLCPKFCSNKEKLEAHVKLVHNPDDVQKKLDALKNVKLSVSESEAEEMLSKHFDMTCDVCGDALTSLQQAQYHYMHEHQRPDGYIKCCGMKFNKNQTVKSHIVWHLNPEIFKCNICGKTKKTIYKLRQHLAVHSSRQESTYSVCDECGKSFSRKDVLTRHIKEMHGPDLDLKQFTMRSQLTTTPLTSTVPQKDPSLSEYFDMACEVCSTTFASLQHAKLHYLDEHSIADGYLKCCGFKFREVKEVSDHLDYHSNPEIFKCHICDKVFSRRYRLVAHLSRHKAIATKRHACDVCGKAFRSKCTLKRHMKTHESTEKRIPCQFCNRRFETEKQQKNHEQRVHNKDEEKAAICEFCAKSFSTRSYVVSHIRLMHTENATSDRVQCDLCQAWLGNSKALRAHISRHTAEPAKCPQCGKVKPNKEALMNHIREVHTERNHKCHLCEKSFKAAYALKGHIATHTGEKPFHCSFCYLKFTWRSDMYNHQKKAHPAEWSRNRAEKMAAANA